MAAAARALARPDAAARIVDACVTLAATEVTVAMLGKTRRIHFVGVGGIGMSGIAELLANLGYAVSRLRREAARRPPSGWRRSASRCTIGHAAAHVGDADVVVYLVGGAARQPRGRRGARAAASR